MAKTVDSAFNDFNNNIINLNSERTKRARKSRDWLLTQLNSFPNKIKDFPMLYEERHIKFGSFARNTKIRPLDDIDLILTFSANGTTHAKAFFDEYFILTVPEEQKELRKLCNDDGTLNSIKVVNKIVSSLSSIEHYKNGKIHRRQEAATLLLSSYDWNFDIVPAFYATDDFYLIPDGTGNWKKTDPRVDQSNVTNINQQHNGKVLQIIRTLKYWQKRPTMPTISSYLFETIILTYFESKDKISEFVDVNIKDFWGFLENGIYNSYPDPKGFQGELNNLDSDTRNKISELARNSYDKAQTAISYEINDNDMKKSINKWKEIFGSNFPDYT